MNGKFKIEIRKFIGHQRKLVYSLMFSDLSGTNR